MRTFILAALAATAVTTATASDWDQRAYPGKNPGIVGTWELTVTLRNCLTGDVAPAPNPIFPALNTFHAGGTLTEFGSRFSPALRNVGHGVWKQTGRSRYTSRFLFQRFDSNGFYIGTQRVVRTIELSGDGSTLSATAKVQLLDTNGAVTMEGCATEEGQRF